MSRTLWLLVAATAYAHEGSMSSSDLTIQGARAHYELRMPLYEVAHISEPERTLLDHIRFSTSGRPAKLLTKSCAADKPRDSYLCVAEYEFAEPVAALDVECTFPSITVATHVHLLRASAGDKNDQTLLDRGFPRATLRFRPMTPFERVRTESTAGFLRALAGPVQILFLAALALASRSRRELATLFAMFLLGQAAAVLIVPRTTWQPSSRFVEASAALTIAYLAVEILLLPKAGARSLVAGVLGGFHGLYFHLFLQASAYGAGWVLAGAAVAEAAIAAILALVLARLAQIAHAFRPIQVAASALLIFGLGWFVRSL